MLFLVVRTLELNIYIYTSMYLNIKKKIQKPRNKIRPRWGGGQSAVVGGCGGESLFYIITRNNKLESS